MGSNIGFYCGVSDNEALQEFSKSIGLYLMPMTMDNDLSADPAKGPFCFLSVVPMADLHPYGIPPVRLTDAKDPMLGFMRSYFANPYLVAGHIHWSNDVPALAVKTKPYYQKITKWIKQNWQPQPGGNFYLGPEAQSLISKGAQMVNVLPGQAS